MTFGIEMHRNRLLPHHRVVSHEFSALSVEGEKNNEQELA